MQDFYQLQQEWLVVTLLLTGIIFISVWIAYSLNIALNYLLGACTGVVYLKMLARDVERLSRQKNKSEQDSVCSVYWVDYSSNSMAAAPDYSNFFGISDL
jgi:hypothetical protein